MPSMSSHGGHGVTSDLFWSCDVHKLTSRALLPPPSLWGTEKGREMLSYLVKVVQTTTASGAPMYNGGSGVDTEPFVPEREGGPTEGEAGKLRDGVLETLLGLDRDVSRWLCLCRRREWSRKVCLLLEWSGHGVLWFLICGLLFLLYLSTSNPSYLTHTHNMFVLLVADIVAVAPMKLVIKRPRPPSNTGTIFLSVSSVDRYAFPSGHASRALALAAYFSSTLLLPPILWWTWALLVSLSRVLSGRHHLLDVVAGMAAGMAVFEVTKLLNWLSLSNHQITTFTL